MLTGVYKAMPILLGPKYSSPPTPVKLMPIHHHQSGFMACCTMDFLPPIFQLIGTSILSLFAFLDLPVAFAPALLVDVGLSVLVGSICGGEYIRYIGLSGAPSNWKRSRRGLLE